MVQQELMTQQRYSQQQLIEKLQEMAARLGRSPTQVEATKDPDIPCHTTYVKRFGSWTAALRAAGLPVDPHSVGYDRETLLEMLRGLVAELGRTPVGRELAELGLPWDATYAKHFGSWTAALAELGLEPKAGNTRYERNELLDVLRDLDRELGHPPSQAELREREGLPHPSTYKYRFGSWNKALEAAGLTPRRRMGG
jgi:hypothetical protein